MKIVRLLFFGVLVALGSYGAFLFFSSPNNIKNIDSFTQAADMLQSADTDTLVVFDVDDTLIMPTSKVYWPRIRKENKEWFGRLTSQWKNKLNPKSEELYAALWRLKEKPRVIEPHIIQIIKTLQNRGVMVLALTALETGSTVMIPSLPEWRSKSLKKLGIDFSKATVPDMVFDELPPGKDGNPPVLYHGILCSSTVSKGLVLGAFLDRIQWKPKRVIYFDNSKKQVTSVAQEMCRRSIPFYGYRYRGEDHVPGKLDKEIGALQLSHLINQKEWLTEDEARELFTEQHADKKVPLPAPYML